MTISYSPIALIYIIFVTEYEGGCKLYHIVKLCSRAHALIKELFKKKRIKHIGNFRWLFKVSSSE